MCGIIQEAEVGHTSEWHRLFSLLTLSCPLLYSFQNPTESVCDPSHGTGTHLFLSWEQPSQASLPVTALNRSQH